MDFDGTLSWLSWVCATFLFSYGFFQRTSTSAYYSDLETEFGLDGAGVGSLSSMYFYIYGIVQIPYGILMDKYGPLRVISSSAFFTFIGALCFSLSPSLFVAYIGRGLVGGAVGVGWIAIIKVIQDDDYFLGKKQVLTGLSLSMGMLGGSLGQGPLAAFCKSSGWRFAMSVTSLIPLFVSICTLIVYKLKRRRSNEKKKEQETKKNDDNNVVAAVTTTIGDVGLDVDDNDSLTICGKLLEAISVRINIYLFTYMLLCFVPILAFASLWAVPFFIQVGGVDRATAGIIATCYIIGTGIGGPVGGAISDRFKQRERQIMICSLLLTSSMLLLVILGTGYWHISISGIIMLLVSNFYIALNSYNRNVLTYYFIYALHFTGWSWPRPSYDIIFYSTKT